MIARFYQSHGGVDRRHPRSKSKTELRAFERSDVLFHALTSWVLRARIFVAFVLAETFLRVRGSLIDRNGDRAGGRVRFCPV